MEPCGMQEQTFAPARCLEHGHKFDDGHTWLFLRLLRALQNAPPGSNAAASAVAKDYPRNPCGLQLKYPKIEQALTSKARHIEIAAMMISLQQAAAELPRLVQLAAQGEHIVIVTEGLPNLELTIAPPPPPKRKAGSLKQAITIVDDHWDKPSDDIDAEFYK